MTIEPGKTYSFTKSGSEVRTIEPTTPYRGQPMWVVERTRGTSAGKRMCVPARALVTEMRVKPRHSMPGKNSAFAAGEQGA